MPFGDRRSVLRSSSVRLIESTSIIIVRAVLQHGKQRDRSGILIATRSVESLQAGANEALFLGSRCAMALVKWCFSDSNNRAIWWTPTTELTRLERPKNLFMIQ